MFFVYHFKIQQVLKQDGLKNIVASSSYPQNSRGCPKDLLLFLVYKI